MLVRKTSIRIKCDTKEIYNRKGYQNVDKNVEKMYTNPSAYLPQSRPKNMHTVGIYVAQQNHANKGEGKETYTQWVSTLHNMIRQAGGKGGEITLSKEMRYAHTAKVVYLRDSVSYSEWFLKQLHFYT